MLDKVTKIINGWDPVHLFPMAPDDEYNWEIEKINLLLEKEENLTIDKLGEAIYEMFVKSFGEDNFKKDLIQCKKIAEIIFAARNVV